MAERFLERAHRDAWRRGGTAKLTGQLLVGMAAFIVLTETFAMGLVEFLWPGGFWKKTLLDEVILVATTLPALYLVVVRPLFVLLAERKESEEALSLRARELAARNAVNSVAARELRTEAMFARIMDVILSVFQADGGWVLLLGQGTDKGAQLVGARGVPPSLLPSGSADLFLDSPTCCGGLLERMPSGEVTLVTECRHLPREVLMTAGFAGYVGVPLPAGHRVRAVLNLLWRAPRTLSEADRALLRTLVQDLAIAAESAALYEAEKRARKLADLVGSATLALNQTLDLDAVLQALFEHLGRLVPYDRAKVLLVEGESHLRVQAVFTPSGRDVAKGTVVPKYEVTRDPLAEKVLATGKSLVGPETGDEPAARASEKLHGEGGWLGVPLVAEGKVIGIVTLVRQASRPFELDEIRLVEAVASPASVAISNARLYDEVASGRERLQTVSRKLLEVRESESRHLAHELHDEVGQSLTAVLYRLAAAKSSHDRPNTVLDEAIEIVQGTMQRVRNISLDLRPTLLDEAGLQQTLRWYIDRQVRSDTLDVGLSVSPELSDLPLEIRTACFRIVQEALTNVVRHSGARRAQVQLRPSGSHVEIVVWDDGRGFDVEEAYRRARTGTSLGILGMRERAELLGGELLFHSSSGAGTTVKVAIPLPEAE